MQARFTVWQIVRQSLPIIYGVMIISMLTGTGFDHAVSTVFSSAPVIVIILPAFINIAGDLSDVFASRLSTALYRGDLNYNFRPLPIFLANIAGVLTVSLISFSATALAGNLVAELLFHNATPWLLTFIVVVTAGFLATLTVSLFGSVLVRYAIKHEKDPDSVISPITTTGGDFVATTLLLVLTQWLLLA